MKTSKDIPAIGFTSILHNKSHKLAEIQGIFLNFKVISSYLPASTSITEKKANFTTFRYEKEIKMNFKGDKILSVKMDSGCVIDSLAGDEISPVLIEFYLLENNLFFRFGGRVRIKPIENHLKIGIYIYDLMPKDALLDELEFNSLKKLIRDEFRTLLTNLNKSDLIITN